MNIAIYSRKSKITESGESIKNQIDLCKEYAYKHFLVNSLLIYQDEGFSGSNLDRPKYQEMMKAAIRKQFDILICYRLDRISRNVLDFSNTLEILTCNNIEFISIRDHFDTSNPMGRAMMYISSVFAQLERETIAERIKDNMYKLAETGRWLGGVTPTGFQSSHITNSSTGKSLSVLTNVQEEQQLIKLLYDKYEQLESLTKLRLYTLKNNIKTKNNKNFNLSSLKNILTNPVYMSADSSAYKYFTNNNANISSQLSKNDFDGSYGIIAFNRHEEYKNKIVTKDISNWIISIGCHQPIISSKQWIKTQNIILKNSTPTCHCNSSSKIALLTPLIKCKICDKPLKILRKYNHNQVTNYYYKCKIKESSHNNLCTLNNLNGKKADSLIVNSMIELISIDIIITKIDEYINLIDSSCENENQNHICLQKKINEINTRIKRLTAILSENTSSTSSHYIINEIENNHAILLKLTNQQKTTPNISSSNFQDIKQLCDFHNILTFEQKKILIKKTIQTMFWDGHNLDVYIK
ncbi:MAG: recombinase family protein [Vallitalea sp.]|jgi:site-specific DNA recombinase|nr:recombinase family protein [Vallitalea sp.]